MPSPSFRGIEVYRWLQLDRNVLNRSTDEPTLFYFYIFIAWGCIMDPVGDIRAVSRQTHNRNIYLFIYLSKPIF